MGTTMHGPTGARPPADRLRAELEALVRRVGQRLGPDMPCSLGLWRGGRWLATHSVGAVGACGPRQDDDHPWAAAVDRLRVVLVPDVGDDGGSSAWSRAVQDAGYRSAVVLPANVDDDADVVLAVYSADRDPWDGELLVAADAQAQAAARALRVVLDGDDASRAVGDYRIAASAYVAVQQAVGVLMARDACGAEAALARLTRDAAERGEPVEERAAAVLTEAVARGGQRQRS